MPAPVRVTGHVVRVVGRDTVAVPGVRVVLHRVTVSTPGPIDSTTSDAHGAFAFRVEPDTASVYLASVRWESIEYFSQAFPLDDSGADSSAIVVVADTSGRASVSLAARHLIVSSVGNEGTRDVVDLYVLDNPGSVTRVAADTAHYTWFTVIPPYVVNVHGGNSAFAIESLRLSGDTVALYAAIPPGQHDVELDYQIPPNAHRVDVPVPDAAPISNIITPDRSIRVRGDFVRSDTVIEKKAYARWEGKLVRGETVTLLLSADPPPQWLLPAMLGGMALILIGLTARVMLRPR
ncbi:MAG TPA: hypothetical protein VGL65_03705 [Gemmatimonadales bacterium]